MGRFRTTMRRKSYDEFFASKLPVTSVQFFGLVLLGGGLIASGVTLFVLALLKISPELRNVSGVVVLLVPTVISAGIVYLGLMHIRRAFAGRH